jgi:hypothetical protein
MTHSEQHHTPSRNHPPIDAAFHALKLRGISPQANADTAFILSLQGVQTFEIGRHQVYSSYEPHQTVVLIHDPTGRNQHKYIIAQADDHTFIVAAPTSWTGLHREILHRVSAATGISARCDGGGYLTMVNDGRFRVSGESMDFGPADHERATKAFGRAIQQTAELHNEFKDSQPN